MADAGAGSGYFTIRVAKAVGSTGIVWAIDIRQEMIDYIANRVKEEDLDNIRLMLVFPDDPQLPQGKVDTILMVDTWHYIRDPEYAKKLRSGLAPGGRVVVVDYRPKPLEERPWGPPPDRWKRERVLSCRHDRWIEARGVPSSAGDSACSNRDGRSSHVT